MDSFHDKVTLIPWQESWAAIFEVERQRIEATLSADAIAAKVYHVGSTSVQGMISKPVIDILVCPHELFSLDETAAALEDIGYANFGECGRPGRYFMSRGNEPNETFYLHLCREDHQVAKDQLLFQKLERSVPEVFQNYIYIKRTAADLFPEDRNAYREMKGWFIDAVLAAARASERKTDDDGRVKYWIYELEMSDAANQVLEKRLAHCEMTLDEYACAAVQYAIDHPEEAKRFQEDMAAHPDGQLDIRVVRCYPVYNGETEAQARKRKLAEETVEKAEGSNADSQNP